MNYDQIFAAITLAVCLVLLVRLALSPARRMHFDATLRTGNAFARAWLRNLWRSRAVKKAAEREAEEAIARARKGDGEWDGNVYRPKSFKRPKKPH